MLEATEQAREKAKPYTEKAMEAAKETGEQAKQAAERASEAAKPYYDKSKEAAQKAYDDALKIGQGADGQVQIRRAEERIEGAHCTAKLGLTTAFQACHWGAASGNP